MLGFFFNKITPGATADLQPQEQLEQSDDPDSDTESSVYNKVSLN